MRIQHVFVKKWLGFWRRLHSNLFSHMLATWYALNLRIDDFFCLSWIYHRQRLNWEHALTDALNRYGESSMQQRIHVENWRRADFSARFGRNAPDAVRCLVREALAAGIPLEDLRLLVLNRDLRVEFGGVNVQCGRGAQALSWLARAVFGSHVLYLAAYTLSKNGPWHVTLFVLFLVFCIYGLLWRGMSLFTTRPLAAARRHRAELIRIDTLRRNAQIHHLRRHV